LTIYSLLRINGLTKMDSLLRNI